MRNTVDSRSQQVQQQRIDTKVQKQTANVRSEESTVKTPELNRPATTQYLNIVANERDDLGDNLSRSYNKLNQALSQTAAAPNEQPVDEQAEKMASYSKLAAKVIDRDPHLQEQVAQDLSTGKKLVRSRNASDTLQNAMSNLPRPLKEGTNSGKQLAKFIVENLVTLTDTKNMGAGLERDLAVRQIIVPKQQPDLRSQQAVSKVLAASIAYVQSNQPEVLKTLESDEPEAVKPGSTTAQVMTRYLRQALNEFPEESTYLDIFKQNRSHQKQEGYADKMSEEIAQRIHNLISKAANTAKSGNLIQLSPEEAARFDQIQRQAAGQGLQTTSPQTQANANALSALTGQNFPHASNASSQNTSMQAAPNANQTPSPVPEDKANELKDVKSDSKSKPNSGNVRDLSLSELSARAAKLQQQFRQERYRLANDGKEPEPSAAPAKTFDNVKTARDILKGTLSPENFALTERQQHIKDQIATQNNNLSTSLVANKAQAQAVENTKVEANTTEASKSEKTQAQAQQPSQVQDKPNTQAQSANNQSTNSLPASIEQGSFAQGTTKAPVSAFQMEFSAIQNTLYGDIDIMPGMTIPVSHFGELNQSTLQPNQQALESLKIQARLLEESLRQQAQDTITQQAPSKQTEANKPKVEMSELAQAVSDHKSKTEGNLSDSTKQAKIANETQTNPVSTGKAEQSAPIQLQQFLQQTAKTLQNSQGGQLTLDASQLHSFLQQAQTLLKQVAPDLDIDLPNLSQTPSGVKQEQVDSEANAQGNTKDVKEAKDATAAVKTPLTADKEGKATSAQATPVVSTPSKAENASSTTPTVAEKLQDAPQSPKDNLAPNSPQQDKALSSSLATSATPVTGDSRAEQADEDSQLSKILDPNKLALTLDKAQQNLTQQIKAQGGQPLSEQVKLGEALANARNALDLAATTPRRLTELLLQVQGALTNQTKVQGNLQTPAQANLQKALNQDLPKLQVYLQGTVSKATPAQPSTPTASQSQATSTVQSTSTTVVAPAPSSADKGAVATSQANTATSPTQSTGATQGQAQTTPTPAETVTPSKESVSVKGGTEVTPPVADKANLSPAQTTPLAAEQVVKPQDIHVGASSKESSVTSAQGDLGTRTNPAVPILGSLFEALTRTQESLQVLQQAPTLPEKQTAFDHIQKYLTEAHAKLTADEITSLPSHKALQQLVGFSELSVINIARANTPELTSQAMQQLNLCLTHGQREVLLQLQALGALAEAKPEQAPATTSATPSGVLNQAQATLSAQVTSQVAGQAAPTAQGAIKVAQQAQEQIAQQAQQGLQGQAPQTIVQGAQVGASSQAQATASQTAGQGASASVPAEQASSKTQGAIQVAQQAAQMAEATTEEAELAAKFNQFKYQGATEGEEAIQNRTANAHIMRAPNLATAIHTNYSDTPDTITEELLVKSAQADNKAQVAVSPQSTEDTAATSAQVNSVLHNLTKALTSNEMEWLSNTAKAAGMTPDEYINSLVQAQIQAEQLKGNQAQAATQAQSGETDTDKGEVLNYRYSNVLYRMQEQGEEEALTVKTGQEANKGGQIKGPELNQAIVSLGKVEAENAEGVAQEDSVFATRTSLAASKERVEAEQEQVQAAQQQKARHAESRESKEQVIEEHQDRQAQVQQLVRQEVQQQQEQDEHRQEQVKAEIALNQQQQQIAQQAVAQGGTKLGINADPDLVDQQFARLYQQQRLEQQQAQQQQQANIAQQIRTGGSSITMAHSDVVAQGAINDDLHQLQRNQSLGIQGNTGASRAAAEAQAQAIAQGTQTIGRTAMMADDGLDPNVRSNATVGNTNVEARTAAAGGTPIQGQSSSSTSSTPSASTLPNASNLGSQGQAASMATSQPTQGALGQGAAATQGMAQGQVTAQVQGQATTLPAGSVLGTNQTNLSQGQNVAGQGLTQSGVAPVNGSNVVPTGDGRTALSVASLNQSMPFGATTPNSSTQLTIHLDDFNMHDPVVQNIGSTVPSKDAEGLNTQALTGVVADTDLNPQDEFSQVLQQSLGADENVGLAEGVKGGVAGAAAITSGQNAPIPDESVVADVATPRESGLLHRIASLFTGKTHDDLGEEISTSKNENEVSANAPEVMKAIQEQNMQNQLKQASLDGLMQRLQTSVTDQNLPQHVREQAHKLMQALENPVADLHSVSSWLNFVTGPMSPSSSQALAMHQWAFLLLCIRFEQIGKNVEKFLKKRMSGDEFEDIAPKLNEAHNESGLFNDLVDEPEEKAQELLGETFSQVARLQQQVDVLPEGQVLPRYIPLPPFYRGGKEGSLQAQQHTDEDGGKSWHLNFNLDLEKLGQLQVKVKLRFPDIQMSFVTSNLETLQAVQTHMPELNARLKEIGLTSKGSSARLGRLQPMHSSVESKARSTYHGNDFNADA